MGRDLILFYVWFIFNITILFCVLIAIFEWFIPKVGSFITKFKNLKGGAV